LNPLITQGAIQFLYLLVFERKAQLRNVGIFDIWQV